MAVLKAQLVPLLSFFLTGEALPSIVAWVHSAVRFRLDKISLTSGHYINHLEWEHGSNSTPLKKIKVGLPLESECECGSCPLALSGRRHTFRRNLSDHNIFHRCTYTTAQAVITTKT